MKLRTVLIVDDDRALCDNLEDMLREEDYDAFSAATCAEGLKLAEERKPDVALIDLKLPNGSGTELLPSLKRANPELVSIMITAHADVDSAVSALTEGAFHYLRKPVRPNELLQLLVQVFEMIRLREEKRKAEEAHRESEERYRMLFNSTNDAMFVYHPTSEGMPGTFVEVNDVACQRYGYTREELLKLSPLDISAPEDVQNVAARLKKLFAEKHVIFQKVQVSKEGRRIPVEISSHLFNLNDQPTVLSAVRDISERKRAEEHIRTLTQELMKAQESERRRIAHDLHDHLAQDLSSVKIGLGTLLDIHSEAPAETRQIVSELSELLQETITAVRDLSYDLRPDSLDQLGLVRTVDEYCEEFYAKNGVKVDFFAGGIDDARLDFDTKITLYRLIQEGLNNVRKHADASQVTIRLVASFPNIILRIEDNGKGFDVENRLVSAANERHMGLRSMKERLGLLQGKMMVESRPMEGTKIFMEFPYIIEEGKGGRKEKNIDR